MAGASAGSLAVATYNCGLDVGAATQALHEFAADCRANGTRYRLGACVGNAVCRVCGAKGVPVQADSVHVCCDDRAA